MKSMSETNTVALCPDITNHGVGSHTVLIQDAIR